MAAKLRNIPVTIMHGKEDQIIQIESAYHASEVLPDSDLFVFAKTGHLLLAEKGRHFYDLVHRSMC
jgi:pimeloyl-ACP methyl ester carboxylesterase